MSLVNSCYKGVTCSNTSNKCSGGYTPICDPNKASKSCATCSQVCIKCSNEKIIYQSNTGNSRVVYQETVNNDNSYSNNSLGTNDAEVTTNENINKDSQNIKVPTTATTTTSIVPSQSTNVFQSNAAINTEANNNTNTNNNNNNSNIVNNFLDNLQQKFGVSKNIFIGSFAGGIVLILLIIIGLVMCCKKPKKGKIREERSSTDNQGYDKLRDENYSSYRSMTNSSLQGQGSVADSNVYSKSRNVDNMPNMDSILIENKRKINSPKINTSNIYRNDMASQSQTSLVNNQSNVSGSELFSKNNTSHIFESTEVSFTNNNNSTINYESVADNSFSKRPVSKLGSGSELYIKSPRAMAQKSIDAQPMSATVTTAEALYTKAVNDSWNYDSNSKVNTSFKSPRHVPNMSFSNEILSPVNTNALLFESKQTFNNMPYSNSPSTPTTKYYQNNSTTTPSSPVTVSTPNGSNLYIVTNKNKNQAVNPFSDSHATHTPTNGYESEVALNTSLINNSVARHDSKDSSDSENQNQSFANISKNYSFKNDNSIINSPVTPRSAHSIKSPTTKHQSLVTSPTNSRKNMKRATITSPTHESFTNVNVNPLIMDYSGILKSPSTPKTPRSAHGTPNLYDSRGSIKQSPSIVRPSTPSGYTPNLQHKSSNKSVHSNTGTTPGMSQRSNVGTPGMSQYSNVGTPGMSQHSMMEMSQHSIIESPLLNHKSSNITMENIPSGMQTLERHHSGKSKFATVTLERVPSNGIKHSNTVDDRHSDKLERVPSNGIKHSNTVDDRHSDKLERVPSNSIKHSNTVDDRHSDKLERVPSNSIKHSNTFDSDNEVSISKSNSLMVMSPSSLTKSSSFSGKSPQPKSILKNANSVSSTKLSSSVMTSPEINKSQSLKGKKSTKSRKSMINSASDINIPQFPSMSRNTLRSDNASISSFGESVPTTPVRPPQLTVFGHAVATPPTPKSTRFPQDAKVLPPVEKAVLVPPDILGGTDVIPLNTMTLQRKHFHKRNRSMNAASFANNERQEANSESNMTKPKISNDHPLPIPPPHHQRNRSNGDAITANSADYPYNSSERIGKSSSRERSMDRSNNNAHYRSKSLPRPNKYNHNNASSRYMDDALPSRRDPYMMNLEQKLTSFEFEFYQDNLNQKVIHTRNKNSVLSILHEEKRNMDYYIAHCDD
ncbi:hypothetical protein BCR36DRAFT_408600 [Piromyces finnis]|uniref:Uncharacterized protein n=1 Tax=Piromyces finnis TaxID=1754191 RepID=A0A1Y1VKS7_9FUNG|nr:hypothetical protein BCR36DRAFT_408600 [Piromyces finnis]|eukprot:ORX59068.1 hypothetical protein BCR36DRAFT_408600 [Piromyces finnis]